MHEKMDKPESDASEAGREYQSTPAHQRDPVATGAFCLVTASSSGRPEKCTGAHPVLGKRHRRQQIGA
jgi:hypothetical protein